MVQLLISSIDPTFCKLFLFTDSPHQLKKIYTATYNCNLCFFTSCLKEREKKHLMRSLYTWGQLSFLIYLLGKFDFSHVYMYHVDSMILDNSSYLIFRFDIFRTDFAEICTDQQNKFVTEMKMTFMHHLIPLTKTTGKYDIFFSYTVKYKCILQFSLFKMVCIYMYA